MQFFFYQNPKFQASSHLLWLHSQVCVGPGRKPRRPVFSERGSILRQESTEPHYGNYSNQSIPNESSKETEKEQNQDDDENIEISGEQPYLEMELGKGPSKTEEPYLEMEVQRNGKDYINVEKYKKSKNKRT